MSPSASTLGAVRPTGSRRLRSSNAGPVDRAGERRRLWRPDWPCPVHRTLGQQRRGGSDPTYRVDVRGRHWRASRTPQGPATLLVLPRPTDGLVDARAWGPGADWVLDRLPALLGADDDWSAFEPRIPMLAEARRRYPDARLGRTGLILESLVPSIIEQKVTGQEAFAGFARLVRRFGDPAPGPGPKVGLFVQPDPARLARIPSWEWLQLEIDPARSRTVVTVARVAEALERLAGDGGPDVDGEVVERKLCSLPGVGEWTSSEVRQRALGDPDAVSFGDYHVAKDVGYALTGEPFDDEQMRAHLEPWRPQRGRVPALIMMAGLHRPRRGPRMAPRTHLPVRRG